MAIKFFKDRNLFHLYNSEFSYYVHIHESKAITCPYFGSYLDDIDLDQISVIGGEDWFSNYYDYEEKAEKKYENLYLNASKMLLPSYRAADVRPSFVKIDGLENNKLDFRYVSHKILKGKPQLVDMPYIRDDLSEAETLEITAKDFSKDVTIILSLSIFENYNVIIRNTKFINGTDKNLWLTKSMSLTQDFASANYDLIHFPGEWLFERQFRRERITEGTKVISSKTGRSSHEHNPFIMLADPSATETNGEVFAVSFMYSGAFKCEVNVGKVGVTRINIGIGDFRYEVKSKESFIFPEGFIVYGKNGFESVSHQLHDLTRERIVRDNNEDVYRSILLNSWEGCYMDFNTEKVLNFITEGKKMGAELFVLDDGWFGNRCDDKRALGDWQVNEEKINLNKVIDECHKNGMKFGIWIEPEMANFDSNLLREHPEYAAVDVKSNPWLSRHQVMLNFANDEVVDYIYNVLEATLSRYEIDYIKWDHNRTMEDYFADNLDYLHQDEFYHRNTLGYYKLADRLTKRFANVHFQGCASGGGRFDFGTLFYFPEIWTSDENDPIQRLFIQYGTSFAYPPSVMGAHVNECNTASYKTKSEIALFGSYGFELDPRRVADKYIEQIKITNEIYKKYRDVVLKGDLFRLSSPFETNEFSIIMVDKNKGKALFLMVNLLKRLRASRFIKLRGLNPNKKYINSFDNKTYKGSYYMEVGINMSKTLNEFESQLVVLEEIK